MSEMIINTIEYIDSNLTTDISIEELAERVNYSVYYFQRVFSSVTGYGIKQYIRQRKLTRAAFDLINTEDKVIDIALRYGFSTSESFSKAFKKQHHVNPSQFRNQESPLTATSPLQSNYKKREKTMKVRIEEIQEQTLVGYKHVVSLENKENLLVIPNLWDELNEKGNDEKLFSINDESIKGILGVCKKLNDHEIEYWIAVNSSHTDTEYESFKLPGSKYAVFEVVGPLPDAIQKGWHEIMSVWIDTSGYDIDETIDLELYTDEDPFKEDLKSEIWIKLK